MVRINPRKDFGKTSRLKNSAAALNVFWLIAICSGFFIVHIWARTWVVKKSYQIGDLRNEVRKLEADLAANVVEKNKIMGPKNLQSWVSRFQLEGVYFQKPQASQVYFLKADQPSVKDESP
jgi:hypothetical protein